MSVTGGEDRYGWDPDEVLRREPDETELQLAEERIGDAKAHIRELQHELAGYEQHLPNDIARAQQLYNNEEELSAEDAAVGLREELSYTLDAMELAVRDAEDYFDRQRVLKGPQKKIGQLPAKDDRSHKGHVASDRLHTLIQEAVELDETLDGINDRMEDLYDVQRDLPDYLTGERTFNPEHAYGTDPSALDAGYVADAPAASEDELQYEQIELETALMESRGREKKARLGSYDAARKEVREEIEGTLADWYSK